MGANFVLARGIFVFRLPLGLSSFQILGSAVCGYNSYSLQLKSINLGVIISEEHCTSQRVSFIIARFGEIRLETSRVACKGPPAVRVRSGGYTHMTSAEGKSDIVGWSCKSN